MSLNPKQKILRICFIASHLPQGGAERQILELIKGLIKKKYQVTVLLYQSDHIFYNELKSLEVNLIVNKKNQNSLKIVKWINNIHFLRKNLKNSTFDILHTFLFFNGLIVRLFSPINYHGKIVYSIRNSYSSVSIFYLLADKLLNNFSVNIFNSKKSYHEIYKNLSIRNQKNNFVIYNGFDTNKFSISKKQKNSILTIGIVGRLTYQKNQIQALRVLNKMKKIEDYQFKIFLIGDNKTTEAKHIKTYLKNNLKNETILLDAQNNIEKYYKMFDLFLLPSLFEGCPNVLFEALLSKCICIVSNSANSDSFIKNKINGFVFDGTDNDFEKKIKNAIDILGSNDHLNIIENGYEYAEKNFSISKMIESYAEIYHKIKIIG